MHMSCVWDVHGSMWEAYALHMGYLCYPWEVTHIGRHSLSFVILFLFLDYRYHFCIQFLVDKNISIPVTLFAKSAQLVVFLNAL